jgi:hypothetical protein
MLSVCLELICVRVASIILSVATVSLAEVTAHTTEERSAIFPRQRY